MATTNEDHTPRSTRGPYRQKRKTPRQTKHNRAKRRICENTLLNPGLPSDLQVTELNQDDDVSEPAHRDEETSEGNAIPTNIYLEDPGNSTPTIYDGTSLSNKSSELVIRAFSARHHLTCQAENDQLKLLHIHLPKPNSIPSSSYKLDKNSLLKPMGVKAVSHYICPLCYTSNDEDERFEREACPNLSCCYDPLTSHEKPLSFQSMSIAGQLKIILTSK